MPEVFLHRAEIARNHMQANRSLAFRFDVTA